MKTKLEDSVISKSLSLDKIEMVKALNLYGKIDFALPQFWFKAAQDLNINTTFFVWDYSEERTFGKPLNILEKFIETFGEDISTKLYMYKHSSAKI